MLRLLLILLLLLLKKIGWSIGMIMLRRVLMLWLLLLLLLIPIGSTRMIANHCIVSSYTTRSRIIRCSVDVVVGPFLKQSCFLRRKFTSFHGKVNNAIHVTLANRVMDSASTTSTVVAIPVGPTQLENQTGFTETVPTRSTCCSPHHNTGAQSTLHFGKHILARQCLLWHHLIPIRMPFLLHVVVFFFLLIMASRIKGIRFFLFIFFLLLRLTFFVSFTVIIVFVRRGFQYLSLSSSFAAFC
mmetsp:Transcript_15623/g.28403  ORF Transcript_15623/g.28403 Transcript_15623/m.28403 type:complete len:242 (+) Transcript_15623:183-908(+)